jgi:hypothetical protein
MRLCGFMLAMKGVEIARRARRRHVGHGDGWADSLMFRQASNTPCVLQT